MTVDEIKHIPKDQVLTYVITVPDYRPQKKDPNPVRITEGGKIINYQFEPTTRTTDLTASKIMWNSVVSTPVAKYSCADMKNFFLFTPLDRYEYMTMPIALIPEEFIKFYNVTGKVKNGYVYMEIQCGMYGVQQSRILANKLLKERLEKHGYRELPHMLDLFKHD